jgi:hypothetical protein
LRGSFRLDFDQANFAGGDFAKGGYHFVVLGVNEAIGAAEQLAGALGAEVHKLIAVSYELEAIFNGNAGH